VNIVPSALKNLLENNDIFLQIVFKFLKYCKMTGIKQFFCDRAKGILFKYFDSEKLTKQALLMTEEQFEFLLKVNQSL